MAVKQVVTQESINPNLIPMIDIMFLILLFFMLSADMGHRELEEVRLPKADEKSVQKDDGENKDRPLTVNCYHVYENELPCPSYASGNICVDESHSRIGIRGHD